MLWKDNGVDELVSEFERGAKSMKSLKGKRKIGTGDHVLNVFSRLVLRGQTRSAVRWLTERDCGVFYFIQILMSRLGKLCWKF